MIKLAHMNLKNPYDFCGLFPKKSIFPKKS